MNLRTGLVIATSVLAVVACSDASSPVDQASDSGVAADGTAGAAGDRDAAGPDSGGSGPDSGDTGDAAAGGDARDAGDAADAGDGATTTCTATGFASSPTSFALPTLAGVDANVTPFAWLSYANQSLSVSPQDYMSYSTVDLDGDGKLDLVVTLRHSDATIGKSAWQVYKGSATGFASSPTSFALPTLAGVDANVTPFASLSYANQSLSVSPQDYMSYSTVDLDGDGQLDLVVTLRRSDASIGKSEWHMYKGSATGFASSPTSFALPTLAGVDANVTPFAWLSYANQSLSVSPQDYMSYSTVDLDGDGELDLVITLRHSDATIGKSAWQVYKGSATGFASAPTSFALPTLAGVDANVTPFASLSYANQSLSVSPQDYTSYSTVDLDGDGKLDLVITLRHSDATIGKGAWKIYEGSATGFASAPTSFALPTLAGVDANVTPFAWLSYANQSLSVSPQDYMSYSTVDIDGDGKLDLVMTLRRSDATIGKSAWKVFKGAKTGFAPAPTSFALPTLAGVDANVTPFASLSYANQSLSVSPQDYMSYSTVDLDGDGKLDLVMTLRHTDPTIGKSAWKVYRGLCP